ncbi:rho GTPase-activating protein 19 isoform X2 [Planococcus citri]|uniref:rho GTPase-activating protein 19 isoform X2 n=1 Tax=Planococcus citri TaxID=170843 RepID=UPI0031F8ABD7
MESSAEITDLDLQLALKLKAKYPEHFQNLVRMHLSFALDLNIDECDDAGDKIKSNPTKWGFGKKVKGALRDSPENNALTEAGISRMHKLILFLTREENICQEGIFRRTGALTRQVQLKTCLNEGMSVNFDDNNFSVHDCASVLKTFLSELPEPLVTDLYYPLYCQISEWSKCNEFEARLLRSLQLLILLLPENNALLLKHVIDLLHTTAKYASQNKMSAENLATLFTPHLLCPRKLTGEALHTNTQMLYQIVVFMITSGCELFKIPAGLAADIRLYWHDKEKKKLSPRNCLNESTADSCVVNTVFSFVDREKTAQENVINPTETALAQLYAHIQSLPESSKKRKLVKQFNKENGYGTPKRVLLNNNDKPHSLTKNISDSLKRHIFSKGNGKQEKSLKNLPNDKFIQPTATPESRFKAHPLRLFDKRLDCMECGCSDTSDEANIAKKLNLDQDDEIKDEPDCLIRMENGEIINERGIDPIPEESILCTQALQTPQTQMKKSLLARKNSVHCKLSTPIVSTRFQGTLTSTPAPVCFTSDVSTPSPFCGSTDDMSPITMSAQKMPKSMQVRACFQICFSKSWLWFAFFSSCTFTCCMSNGWFGNYGGYDDTSKSSTSDSHLRLKYQFTD